MKFTSISIGLLLYCFTSISIVFVSGINILAVTTLISKSHHIFNDVFLFALAKRGYNVTLLGHDEDNHKHPNYTHIVMEGMYDVVNTNEQINDFAKLNTWEQINLISKWTLLTCEHDLNTKGFKSLMDYPDMFKFDLIIWDITCGHCLYPLIQRFGNPPVVALTAFVLEPNVYGNVPQTFIPYSVRTYSDRMSFLERLDSTFWMTVNGLVRRFYLIPEEMRVAKTYFGVNIRHFEDVERDISVILVNYNAAFHYNRALPPNIILIGGMHIQEKTLPEDFKKILDNAKEGVILLSFGTNVKSAYLGTETINALLSAFSKLKQTVVWKFEDDSLKNVPKNVIIRKWVPQGSLLGHPNLKLFITHGGSLSLHEAVYHGVPLIAVPFFLDQVANSGLIVHRGIGKTLSLQELSSSDTVYKTISEVLNDDRYAKNAKRLSSLYRDTQNKPLDTAIYWTEYVLRHGTAKHFDLATRDMGYLAITDLDLLLTAFLALIVMAFSIFKCCSILLRCCFKRSKVHEKVL